MDRIFREIKKAIEEEMRNAESGPPPGGGRAQGGGRRAREYAEWLKDEQERLRGDGGAQSQSSTAAPSREEVPREVVPPERIPQAKPRRPRSSERHLEGSERQRHENQPRRPQQPAEPEKTETPARRTQHQRSQAAFDRQTSSAYDYRRSGSALGRDVARMLKTPNGLRQAFLLREIISKPVSLRDQDDHLIT